MKNMQEGEFGDDDVHFIRWFGGLVNQIDNPLPKQALFFSP